MTARVIYSNVLVHTATGRVFSPYSAILPGTKADDYHRVPRGFTIEWPDGTVGIGRAPFATEAEAQAYIDAHPRFRGMNQG